MVRASGKDLPWGDFTSAWTLLKNGKIEEGRELLRRLCKHHPSDRDNLALGAFEGLRAPEDRKESSRLIGELHRLFPDAGEFHALRTIGLFDRSPRLAYESFRENHGKTTGILCTFLIHLQEVAISDIQHQVLFANLGTTIEFSIVQPVLKGVALFLLRRQQEAVAMFVKGYREADQMPALYMRHLGITLTQFQRQSLASMIQLDCLRGLYLTLFDLGLDDLAKGIKELREQEKLTLSDILLPGIPEEVGLASATTSPSKDPVMLEGNNRFDSLMESMPVKGFSADEFATLVNFLTSFAALGRFSGCYDFDGNANPYIVIMVGLLPLLTARAEEKSRLLAWVSATASMQASAQQHKASLVPLDDSLRFMLWGDLVELFAREPEAIRNTIVIGDADFEPDNRARTIMSMQGARHEEALQGIRKIAADPSCDMIVFHRTAWTAAFDLQALGDLMANRTGAPSDTGSRT
jgi:hypothetical protein